MPIFKRIVVLLNLIRLFPQFFVFLYKKELCSDDVRRALSLHRVDCSINWGFCYLMVFDKTFRNLFYWRVGKIKYLLWYWMPPHNSFTIATYMKVGKGFLGIHPIGTFVNADAIGDNFTVKNSVTIGNSTLGRPTIGDNVEINANSVVVGKIKIGNNVVVGAGTVLMKNVPDDCVVVGNPAYILKRNGVRVNEQL